MKSKNLLARMRELCAELGPDDGMAPHELEKLERTPRTPSPRLGGQIQRALSLALATSSDPRLSTLWVAAARPDPDATRFRVEVQILDPDLQEHPREIEACLRAASGWLRTEVAQSICRKKAPELIFVCVPPEVAP